jgi:hypothetical protein
MDNDGDGDRSPELVEQAPDPLTDRLAQFRSSGDDRASAGELDDDAEQAEEQDADAQAEDVEEEQDEDVEQQEQALEEVAEEDAEDPDKPAYEKPATDKAGEGEGAEGTDGAGETFALDFLNVAALKDPKSPHAAVLHLEGLPQDYRDSIAAHVKRSQQFDQVSQRLEKARELETVARFYQADPLNAMRLVAVEKPELATEFVTDWVLQNPKATLALIRQHKLDGDDPEKLELRGQLAQKKMLDALGEAYSGVQSQTAHAEFLEQAGATIDELVEPLALEGDDQRVFADAAAATVQRVMAERRAQRQSPYLGKAELIDLLQPLVKRFAGGTEAANGKATKPKPKAGKKPQLTREEMIAKAKRTDTLRRQQGGGTLQPRAKPTALTKSKLPRDMGERIKLLRAGKL